MAADPVAISLFRHPRESGDPPAFPGSGRTSGTPAFAGVTGMVAGPLR